MTAYALRLENATDTAARVRIGDLLGLTPADALTARTGIRPAPGAGDVAVVDGTMQVTVQPFVAWVQGGISDAQGGYPFVLDAEATLLLGNGDATLDRIDTVAAVVKDDPYDGSGELSAAVVVLVGTPGGTAPALPDNCLPLFDVDVPAGASAGTGGLTSGNLSTDRRTYVSSLGGVVTVASSAERDALPATNGTLVYRKDTDVLEVRRAGAWTKVATDDLAPRGLLTTAAQGAMQNPGDTTPCTAPAVVNDGGRNFRIVVRGQGRCNAVAATGHSISVFRSVNGGAETDMGGYVHIYPHQTFYSDFSFTLWDPNCPTGSVVYRLRAQGYGGNGNDLQTTIMAVYDDGAVAV